MDTIKHNRTMLLNQNKLFPYRILKTLLLPATFFMLLLLSGCKKDFLETKPNKALLVPQTLTDFQRLLDNTSIMSITPSLTLVSVDEHYVDQNTLNIWLTPAERNSYTWAEDIFEGQNCLDWDATYKQIFYCNVVLEGMDKLDENEKRTTDAAAIRGAALFYRAYGFYNLAQMFCAPYQISGNERQLGLPLKLTADINELVQRSSLEATYQQIITDLKASSKLLPESVASKNRPTTRAAMALLARIYQTMQDYPEALRYANEVLNRNAYLLDFNTLNATVTSTANPFPPGLPAANPEVIFYSGIRGYSFFNNNFRVDSTIYQSYQANDLRKPVFFVSRTNGQINVKGQHGGTVGAFSGLANDELLLIRAESYARAGNTAAAMADLNQLLVKRFKAGTYINRTAVTAQEALAVILAERRKEMFKRGLRWTDLRRLNQDPSTAIVVQHNIGGKLYTLEPKSPKYTYPIPPDEIRTSGIQQNPR